MLCRLLLLGMSLLLSCTPAVAVSEEAQGEVYFPGTLQVNQGFENFLNGFVTGLFADFTTREVHLERDHAGQIANEFENGQLNGQFFATLGEDDQASKMQAQFSLQIGQEQERGLEYEIHMQVEGSVSQPETFLQKQQSKTLAQCQQSSKHKSFVDSAVVCEKTQQAAQGSEGVSAPRLFLLLAQAWKEGLLSQFQNLQDPNFSSIREDFVHYLDSQIMITEQVNGDVSLVARLPDLSDRFSARARQFLDDYELRDYHYQLFEVQVSAEQIVFRSHVVKLHVKERFRLYMSVLGQMSSTLEDPAKGVKIGEDFARGDSIKDSLISKSTWSETLTAGALMGMSLVTGNEEVAPEEKKELNELGLD